MRILYIDIDSCRPDHLGCYGYHRNTSPHIDALAREGVLFRQCYTSDAPCLPSRTALYSGRFGIQTGVVGHGGTAAEPKREGAGRGFNDAFAEYGLASRLQALGYRTAMISPFGQRHGAHWFYAGFNEIHNTGRNGVESAHEVWPATEAWLRREAARDRWFLHLNFWDVHTPYRVPDDYGHPFASAPLPGWLERDPEALLARHMKQTGPHTALDFSMYDDTTNPAFPRHPGKITDRASLRQVIDGYDTAVRFVDEYVGRVVAALKAAGVYEDTAIIISADHGENLGELGIYGEHGTADAATCRIPLIVKWPGGLQGVQRNALRYNLDLAPTLLELLGGESPRLWDGSSFARAVTTDGWDHGHADLIVSQCAHVCQRSVLWDDWLYLRTYHDGFHLFPQEMLFNLTSDPHEQTDLASLQPDRCREGAWRLARWHDAQMQRMALNAPDCVDPLWTVIREGGPFHSRVIAPGNPGGPDGLRNYLKRLSDTGRAAGAQTLRERFGMT